MWVVQSVALMVALKVENLVALKVGPMVVEKAANLADLMAGMKVGLWGKTLVDLRAEK